MNKIFYILFQFLGFEAKGRIHIIHEELRRSLPGNIRTVSQQLKDGATTPARQRHSQCVVSDSAFFTS